MLGQSLHALSAGNPTSVSSGIANKPVDKASSDAMRVLLAATELVGEANTASSWFPQEPLSAFSFKTAEQLVHEGRTEDVLAYLHSLQAGAVG